MSIQTKMLRFKSFSANSYTRWAGFIGITAAVLVPFLLLTIGGREASNIPWYVWATVPMLLLLVVAVGVLLFNRRESDSEDISIRPKNR